MTDGDDLRNASLIQKAGRRVKLAQPDSQFLLFFFSSCEIDCLARLSEAMLWRDVFASLLLDYR